MTGIVYQDIYQDILDKIKSGKLKPGSKLSPERKLCEKYNASNTSVRKALDLLSNEQVIEKRRGSGNYVKGYKDEKEIGLLVGQIFNNQAFFEFIAALNSSQNDFKLKIFLANADMERLDSFAIKLILAKNKMPFLILTDRGFTEMAEQDMIMPMDELPGVAGNLELLPASLKTSFKGLDGLKRIYKLPIFICPTAFAVNESLAKKANLPVDNPPQTWEDVLRWSEIFIKWRNEHDMTSFSTHLDGLRTFTSNFSYYLMGALRHSVYCDDVDISGMNALIRFFLDLYRDDHAKIAGTTAPDAFVSGKYLFNLSARSWIPNEMRKYNPGLKYKLLPMPTKKTNDIGRNAVGSIGFGVAPNGKEISKDVLAKAMKSFFFGEKTNEFADKAGIIPANLDLFRDTIKRRPEYRPFYDALPYYCQEPDSEKNTRIIREIDYYLSRQLMLENIDLHETVENIHGMIKHIRQFKETPLIKVTLEHEASA